MLDFFDDHPLLSALLVIAAIIGLFAWAMIEENKERDQRYHELLGMAQTKQDSLNVMLAFEKLKSEQATRSAIIGAGALAGQRR